MHSRIINPPSARTQYPLTNGNPYHPVYVAALRELGTTPLHAVTHSLVDETVARLAPRFLNRRIRLYRYRSLCRKVYSRVHSTDWTPPNELSPLMALHYQQRRERSAWVRSERAAWRYAEIAAFIADGHSIAEARARFQVSRATVYRARQRVSTVSTSVMLPGTLQGYRESNLAGGGAPWTANARKVPRRRGVRRRRHRNR